MYLVALTTAVTEALKRTFADDPNSEWRDVYVGIEYPLEPQHYPGIWVQYDDRDNVRTVGIDHREYVADVDEPDFMHEVTRWQFSGTVTLTAVALTSMERDRLYDEMVRIYAFARIESNQTVFRTLIEAHDLIGITMNWDEIRPSRAGAMPGTPWGTEDDVVYERSLSFDIAVGQFRSAVGVHTLIPLSQILVSASEVNNRGEVVDVLETRVDADTPGLWGPPV